MLNKIWELEAMLERGIDSQVLWAECIRLLNSPSIEIELLKENVSDDDSLNGNIAEIKQWLRLNGFNLNDNALTYVVQLVLLQTLLKIKDDKDRPSMLTQSWLDNKKQDLQDKFEAVRRSFNTKQQESAFVIITHAIQRYWLLAAFMFYAPEITDYFLGNEDNGGTYFEAGARESFVWYRYAVGLGMNLVFAIVQKVEQEGQFGFFKKQTLKYEPYLHPPRSGSNDTIADEKSRAFEP